MANAVLKGDEIAHQVAKNPNGYLALATQAAQLEREEKYQAARELWDAAYRAANNAVNRQWAGCRAAFCLTCIHRFGKRAA
ncbi:ANR family transcriptional regulator [Aeromonas allosaccharophila]|uniref:ANR family transcriptional regulator n=1 Tax=Aeromonas allosaccharophila TaxID=656 RepID=UPI001F3BF831|nr:ANR family transcriptional regulator [Aeromonas allosaccharophila]MCE9848371.1 ANR family transcriptional regulator [Aeromonas allosaccharophila]